jgi:2-polyprenyl-3-methyl-5-hydroxy-6-metoxy-1,4-benzoquinol methylase
MNKEAKLVEKCLDEMYRKSKPSITWNKIKKKYWDTGIQFCHLHKIKEDDYEMIKEKYKKKMNKGYWKSLEMELLNYSPTFEEK